MPQERKIFIRPPSTAGAKPLPQGPARRRLGQDPISDGGEIIQGLLGFGYDPLEGPEGASQLSDAAKIGSVGAMLPFGRGKSALMALLKRAGVKIPDVAAAPKALTQLEQAMANRKPVLDIPQQPVLDTKPSIRERVADFVEPRQEPNISITTERPKPAKPPVLNIPKKSVVTPEKVEHRGLAIERVPDSMKSSHAGKVIVGAQAASKQQPLDNVVQGLPVGYTPDGQMNFGNLEGLEGKLFTRELNKLNLDSAEQSRQVLEGVRGYGIDQDMKKVDRMVGSLSDPDVRASELEAARMSIANQPHLPLKGAPLISYDAGVDVSEAERAGKHLRELHDVAFIRDPENTPSDLTDLVRTMHLRNQNKLGGSYDLNTKGIETNMFDPEDTIGHEFQHALDHKKKPDVFKDYPNMSFSAFTGTPAEYPVHPSEVRARAGGAIGKLLGEARETGQQPLDLDFLEEFGRGTEMLRGKADQSFLLNNARINLLKKERQEQSNSLKTGYEHIGAIDYKRPLQQDLFSAGYFRDEE